MRVLGLSMMVWFLLLLAFILGSKYPTALKSVPIIGNI